MSENALLKQVLLEVSRHGARLFRNNVGFAWVGIIVKNLSFLGARDILIKDARPLRAGLCEGSSDLIGWTTITITEQMVGKPVAVFTAQELKTGRQRATALQRQFIEAVNTGGGIAGVVRSTDDSTKLIHDYKRRYNV